VHSNNVLYKTGMEFNGGTQIHTVGNLFIQSGWSIGPTPDVASSFHDSTSNTAGSRCEFLK